MKRTRKKIKEEEVETLDKISAEEIEKEDAKKKSQKRHEKRGEYMVNIFVNLLLLYFFNNLLLWNVGFITSDFTKVLPFVNWSIEATILFNLIYIFYKPRWFKKFTQIILNILAIIFLRRLYIVFPFIMSSGFTSLFRFCLSIAMLVIFIITLVNFVQFLISYSKKNGKNNLSKTIDNILSCVVLL